MKYSTTRQKNAGETPEIRRKELMYMSQYMALILRKEKLQGLKLTG